MFCTIRYSLSMLLALLLLSCGSLDHDLDSQDPTPHTNPEDPADPEDPQDPADPQDPTDPAPAPPGSLAKSSLERDLDPAVSTETLIALTAGNRDFAFDLFAALLAEDDDNLFISPHSISIALAMAYAGADGESRAEMREALRIGLEDDQLHTAFNALALELEKRSQMVPDEGDSFTFEIINQSWGQTNYHFEADYLDLLAQHYGAGLLLVDFAGQYEEIREDINEWVEAVTRGRIEDLLPWGSISSLTRFVLVNAIYFYGSWFNAFQESATQEGFFTALDGSSVVVDLMRQTHEFGYMADGDVIAVSLPYVGEEVSMVAFMPASSTADFRTWEGALTRAEFDRIVAGLYRTQVDLTFPKFQSESSLSLVGAMELLGMQQAFDYCAADFRRMTGAEPCIPLVSLYISDILHKSFVSVDEEGTEAAAATAVIFATTDSTLPPEPVEVRFDRPFYYAIYDHPTQTILFLGRLVDPTN